MKILVSYRGIPQSKGWATGDSVVRAFRALDHDVYTWGHYYGHPEQKLENHGEWTDYDLVVYMEMNDGDQQYGILKNIPARRKVAWLFDVEMQPQFWKALCDHMEFDRIFCANTDFLEFLNADFLPYAADTDIHYRPLDFPKKRVASLVGSDRQSRRQLIASVDDAEFIAGVYREKYIDALGSSLISICDVAGGGAGLMPMRFFEAPAAGSLLVCQVNNQNRDDVMREGQFYLGYTDDKDLPGIIDFLKSDIAERERLTVDGHNHVLLNHTYKQRCEYIIEACGL
jgi:hypothetical protein